MMKKFMSGLFASAIAVSMTIASFVPVEAAPMMTRPASVATQGDVVQVQSRHERRLLRRNFRRESRHDRRDFRREDRRDFYRGHRGSRNYRQGYRRHGNYWFPAAAFITGAIIGGAINNSGPVVRSGGSHTQWCYDRYRSYRASDNTYQPNDGPRRQCNSPY